MDTTIQPQAPAATAEEQTTEELDDLQLIPSDMTPEEFYAAITQREDVRLILAELASS